MTKFVRMTSTNTTEWNHSTFGIFTPRDDAAFQIPEAAVPDALKAGLVVAEHSQSRKLIQALDQIRALDSSPQRDAILSAAAEAEVAAWEKRKV